MTNGIDAVLTGGASWHIALGDVRDVLSLIPDNSVHCVATSPPYFGLRDYGVDGQIGLEPTPAQFVTSMTEVFRDVRRVLHPSGVLWLNLGDSYAGSWKNQGRGEGRGTQRKINGPSLQRFDGHPAPASGAGKVPEGLKPKDLIGIPWRVALALQDDGWWLRSDVIWAKGQSFDPDDAGSVMPESVTDRPTKGHEYVFLLTKSARYFYDAEAVKEPAARGAAGSSFSTGKTAIQQLGRASSQDRVENNGRNLRTVWRINPEPFSGAHFATFPTKLVETMIAAGSRPGDVVLDPFSGAGTTVMQALRMGRRAIGIELNPEYRRISIERIAADAPMLNGAPAVAE